jgi:hypothetical protein
MALDLLTWQFHELAGHDGSRVVFEHLPDPLCRRGFHINEAVVVALNLGYSATPVELMPQIASTPVAGAAQQTVLALHGRFPTEARNQATFDVLIQTRQGVIECRTRSGNWHAVAFETGSIYDPDGREFEYSTAACEKRGLFTTRLWIIEKSN